MTAKLENEGNFNRLWMIKMLTARILFHMQPSSMRLPLLFAAAFFSLTLFSQGQPLPKTNQKIEPKVRIPRSKTLEKPPLMNDVVSGPYFDPREMIFVDTGYYERIAPGRDRRTLVFIRSSYYISKYEVTFDQFDIFCQATGRTKPNDNGWGRGRRPVINVSHDDALAFCEWLSGKTGLAIRLPTEAEWEFAANEGMYGFVSRPLFTSDPYHPVTYSVMSPLPYLYPTSFGSGGWIIDVGWIDENSDGNPHKVGLKRANFLGFHDMTGNVNEWCSDWYSDEETARRGESNGYYGLPKKDPTGPARGRKKTIRGGAYNSPNIQSVVGYRDSRSPNLKYTDVGFRIAYSAN